MDVANVEVRRTGRPQLRSIGIVLLITIAASILYAYHEPIADALHPGQTWDESEFGIPITLKDGKTGVFAYSYSFYRLEGGGIFPFSGAKPNYFRDVKLIGTVNLETGQTKILQREKHKRHGDGKGKFILHSAIDDSVLVLQEATSQADYQSPWRYFVLNVTTNLMTELPLKKEHEENGVRPDHYYLAKPDGTMVFVTGSRNGFGNLWVRLASGRYVHLGAEVGFSGFRENEVHYSEKLTDFELYGPEPCNPCRAFNVSNQTVREISCRSFFGIRGQGNTSRFLWPESHYKELYVIVFEDGVEVKKRVKIPGRMLR